MAAAPASDQGNADKTAVADTMSIGGGFFGAFGFEDLVSKCCGNRRKPVASTFDKPFGEKVPVVELIKHTDKVKEFSAPQLGKPYVVREVSAARNVSAAESASTDPWCEVVIDTKSLPCETEVRYAALFEHRERQAAPLTRTSGAAVKGGASCMPVSYENLFEQREREAATSAKAGIGVANVAASWMPACRPSQLPPQPEMHDELFHTEPQKEFEEKVLPRGPTQPTKQREGDGSVVAPSEPQTSVGTHTCSEESTKATSNREKNGEKMLHEASVENALLDGPSKAATPLGGFIDTGVKQDASNAGPKLMDANPVDANVAIASDSGSSRPVAQPGLAKASADAEQHEDGIQAEKPSDMKATMADLLEVDAARPDGPRAAIAAEMPGLFSEDGLTAVNRPEVDAVPATDKHLRFDLPVDYIDKAQQKKKASQDKNEVMWALLPEPSPNPRKAKGKGKGKSSARATSTPSDDR